MVAIAATVYCPDRYISPATPDLVGSHDRRPAAVAAADSGGLQSCGGAFADEVAFELGQGGEDVKDELAAGGGGVDRLLQAATRRSPTAAPTSLPPCYQSPHRCVDPGVLAGGS